jgi:hypothetical protein
MQVLPYLRINILHHIENARKTETRLLHVGICVIVNISDKSSHSFALFKRNCQRNALTVDILHNTGKFKHA